ncbi:MAG: oligoendopeptidase F [Bacteroidota bacterium]
MKAIGSSRERDRAKISDGYKWDPTHLYPSDAAWREAKGRLLADIPELGQFRGRLADSAMTLLSCLEAVSQLTKEYARLYVYASLNSDVDTRESAYLAMVQEVGQIGSDFAAKTSFVRPEILTMGRETVEAFLAAQPRLGIYRHDLDDILRRKEHTGTEGEEKIIADASLMADGPDNIFGIFSNADFPFPEVILHDGERVKLDKAAFSLYRTAPNRADRKAVFESYLRSLNGYRRTFGGQLYAQVKKDLFYMRARKYESCLQGALDGNNIPTDVYTGLIQNANRHLKSFHRYLALRKRLLGVEELHYYDLYAPIVPEEDLHYSYDEARELVIDSLAPLGAEYQETVKRAFTDRWMDVYPSEGKRAGAYSNGAAYDIHPYVLLNYNGKYDDVSTIAHELGHTMHSHLSNTHQPYPLSHYSIFVAEVASTFNEALLLNHMLKSITDDAIRLSLLGNYLDGLRATVFRQTQFAEFELRIHEMAERGETLTGDILNEVYDGITRRYYGHDSGLCVVDEECRAEWANVPHFYYNFYVFQYATSFTASAALSEKVISGDSESTQAYLRLLSAGGSDYPIALLSQAGVDMTGPVPFELTMQKMNRVLDEMESICGGGG